MPHTCATCRIKGRTCSCRSYGSPFYPLPSAVIWDVDIRACTCKEIGWRSYQLLFDDDVSIICVYFDIRGQAITLQPSIPDLYSTLLCHARNCNCVLHGCPAFGAMPFCKCNLHPRTPECWSIHVMPIHHSVASCLVPLLRVYKHRISHQAVSYSCRGNSSKQPRCPKEEL